MYCLTLQHAQLQGDYKELQEQHSTLDAAYSDELLKTAKLHGQLSELQLLRTQHTMYDSLTSKKDNKF